MEHNPEPWLCSPLAANIMEEIPLLRSGQVYQGRVNSIDTMLILIGHGSFSSPLAK